MRKRRPLGLFKINSKIFIKKHLYTKKEEKENKENNIFMREKKDH